MPHCEQIWNSAVRVPNAYFETSEGFLTATFNAPRGLEVHTPPCLMQNEQPQARAGISVGSGSQVREKEIFPQWHLPWISTPLSHERSTRARAMAPGSACTQRIFRFAVKAPNTPATMMQARKKLLIGSPFAPRARPHINPAARKPLYRP